MVLNSSTGFAWVWGLEGVLVEFAAGTGLGASSMGTSSESGWGSGALADLDDFFFSFLVETAEGAGADAAGDVGADSSVSWAGDDAFFSVLSSTGLLLFDFLVETSLSLSLEETAPLVSAYEL
jgi:hypothetical protein